MQAFHGRNILIRGQKVSDINPLYKVAQHVTWPAKHYLTQSNSEQCNIHTSTRVSPANFGTTVIFRLTKIIRSGITFVSRNLR